MNSNTPSHQMFCPLQASVQTSVHLASLGIHGRFTIATFATLLRRSSASLRRHPLPTGEWGRPQWTPILDVIARKRIRRCRMICEICWNWEEERGLNTARKRLRHARLWSDATRLPRRRRSRS